MRKLLLSFYSCVALSGCAAFSPSDLAKPTDLGVDVALAQVGKGFAEMRNNLKQQDVILGLYACKVVVNMNVTASAAQGGTGKLVIDASTAPSTLSKSAVANQATANATIEQTNTSEVTRGNTILVEMYSPACLPTGTLGHDTPGAVGAVAQAMRRGGARPATNNVHPRNSRDTPRDDDVTIFSTPGVRQ